MNIIEHLKNNFNLSTKQLAEIEANIAKTEARKEAEAYGNSVEKLIREKYSLNDELAILRQRDTKPEEFAEYNAFVEECKAKVKGKNK